MTESQINQTLRHFLTEPLTEEQKAAVAAYTHFQSDEPCAAILEAREIILRNWSLPRDFCGSLDACAQVESRLSTEQREDYAGRLIRGAGTFGALFVTAENRAAMLVEVLELELDE